MKEHPILFNGEMVRAILEGRKTQTRRVVKPQPAWVYDNRVPVKTEDADPEGEIKCPYGQTGDRLWVREAHAIVPRTAYAASDGVWQALRPDDDHDAAVFREGWTRSLPGRWRPSIHMPRWASRITLEITDVRVERLRYISDADARGEGVDRMVLGGGNAWRNYGSGGFNLGCPVKSFASLWGSINSPDSWDANPWVWVVDFKHVEQGGEQND